MVGTESHRTQRTAEPGGLPEVTLRDYLAVLPRYYLLILLLVVGGAGGAVAFTASQPEIFEARATLLIQQDLLREVNSRSGLSAGVPGDSNFVVSVAGPAATEAVGRWSPTYAALLRNRRVASQVLESLSAEFPKLPDVSADDFVAKAVRAQEVRNSNLLELYVRLPNPELAARAANALAEQIVSLDRTLQQQHALALRDAFEAQMESARERLQKASGGDPIELALAREVYLDLARQSAAIHVHAAAGVSRLYLVDPATVPAFRISPSLRENLLIAVTAALVLGVLLAFAVDYFYRPGSPLRSRPS
jgi:uncharacterized protein involved in exopolysaccharide biosynthesis